MTYHGLVGSTFSCNFWFDSDQAVEGTVTRLGVG